MLPAAEVIGIAKKNAGARSRTSSTSSFRGKGSYGRGGFPYRGRSGAKKGTAAARKPKASKPRKSNGSSTSGPFSKSTRGSGPTRPQRGGGSGGGIGMMPT